MPSTAMPSASLPRISSQLRVLDRQGGGALAHLRREQQLAARRRPEPLGPLVEGALVGGGEVAQLVDLVAPELHADRVRLGGREDVEQATADGELAALLDQLHAGVGGVDQRAGDVVEVGLVARLELDRDEVAEARRQRLQHAAHRGDEDVDRAVLAGVGEVAQHGEPAPDGVGARAEPLVGQRLPGGEGLDPPAGDEAAEQVGDLVGVPLAGGDDEDRHARRPASPPRARRRPAAAPAAGR